MEKISIEVLSVMKTKSKEITTATVKALEELESYNHNVIVNVHTGRIKEGYMCMNPTGFVFNCNMN